MWKYLNYTSDTWNILTTCFGLYGHLQVGCENWNKTKYNTQWYRTYLNCGGGGRDFTPKEYKEVHLWDTDATFPCNAEAEFLDITYKNFKQRTHFLVCFVCVTNWSFSFPSVVIVLFKQYCNTKNTSSYIFVLCTNHLPCHVLPVILYRQCTRFNRGKSRWTSFAINVPTTPQPTPVTAQLI